MAQCCHLAIAADGDHVVAVALRLTGVFKSARAIFLVVNRRGLAKLGPHIGLGGHAFFQFSNTLGVAGGARQTDQQCRYRTPDMAASRCAAFPVQPTLFQCQHGHPRKMQTLTLAPPDSCRLWPDPGPPHTMPLFWTHYKSDVTSFIEELKAKKPTLEAEQRQGRALLWDKRVDRQAQHDYSEATVAQQPYVYGNKAG